MVPFPYPLRGKEGTRHARRPRDKLGLTSTDGAVPEAKG